MKSVAMLLISLFATANLALAAVNLNTATKEELDGVKGIGASKAQAIVDHRTKNGPFKTVEDLAKVKGFGEKSVTKLKGELTVSDSGSKPQKTAK